jgi:hypothetical protein
MKFTKIFGNPPFQDNTTKKKTQHKLWPIFTDKAVNEWLVDGGSLLWISPTSWGSPSNKVFEILKENDLQEINFDTGHHFPGVGSTFSNYKLVKQPTTGSTNITKDGKSFSFPIDNDSLYIPNDFCKDSMGVHKKVIFDTKDKFTLNYDYVTCHNVIRHAKKLHEKKISKCSLGISKLLMSKDPKREAVDKMIDKYFSLISERDSVEITVSEVKTSEHIYPIFHTNNKIWYSSVKQSIASKKKVMWSRSGYVKAFYDDGKLGCTDMGYFILVDNDVEGKRLEHFLNSELMTYIFKTAKWSGFGNEIVFSSIPKIDLSKDHSDLDYYKMFGVTMKEIAYIQSILSPKTRKSSKKKDATQTKSEKRVKQYGEVFTPSELIREMMSQVSKAEWLDISETFIDPACGNGNFLVEILDYRLALGVDPEVVVENLYGIDIMPDNIVECHIRMFNTLKDHGHNPQDFEETIKSNVVLSNSLEKKMSEIFHK